ncbi:beta-ketoacyl-ACP synthase [Helicobacter sp. MIT 14-3879]|nr:beta-ketoacyl-ACP synthase [Helicobacter sp. MIT 14-3879]
MRRVVVTGIGMVNALGLDKESSFERIIEGACGIKHIESFDTKDFPVRIAGEIRGFNPESVLDAREAKKAHRFIQLALLATKEALLDSNKNVQQSFLDSNLMILNDITERFGVSSGAGIGGLETIQNNSIACYTKGPRRINPFFIPSALVNMLSGFISIQHKIKGANLSSVTACAAGTHAIIEAAKTIMLGSMDKMLAVAGESTICAIGIGGFAAMKALSSCDDPQKASRPFDKKRDGFVMGEGAGALVLEEYEQAKARGAFIYAEICGFGESGDANHITTPASEGEGAYRAMRDAIKMAGIRPDYINAHGTSTYYNDMFETQALKRVFDNNVPPVSSTKGQLGHCLGAAGAIEAVISILAMHKGIMPPTINQEEKDELCDLDYIPNLPRKAAINSVMSNSFGFGGTNAVVIFKKV